MTKRLRWLLPVAAISAVAWFAVFAGAQESPEQARAADAFVDSIGVNTHLNYFGTSYDDYPLVEQKLSALGIRHIRDKAQFSGNVRYNEVLYGRYRDLADRGIRTNLVVDPRSLGLGYVDRQKISSIARMAGGALESFEGPNEYDVSGVPTWATDLRGYQRDLYTSVKENETTSDVPVLAPSLAHHANAEALGYLGGHLDYGNMHPYANGEHPGSRRLSENVSDTIKVSGEKPLIASEAGYHNALGDTSSGQPGVSERAAARYVPRMFLEHFNRGIQRTYAYEFIDLKPDPQRVDREKNFGLLRQDGSEKPAYRSLRNLIGLLEDPGPAFEAGSLGYSLGGETAGVRRTLLQKRDGRFYLVLWREVPSYETAARKDVPVPARRVTLNLNTSVAEAVVYLPANSNAPVARHRSPARLDLAVPDHPLVVEVVPE